MDIVTHAFFVALRIVLLIVALTCVCGSIVAVFSLLADANNMRLRYQLLAVGVGVLALLLFLTMLIAVISWP